MDNILPAVTEIQIKYNPPVNALERPVIRSSEDSNAFIRQFFESSLLSVKEEAAVLYLNRANRVLGGLKISSGGISCTVVDPCIVLGVAAKCLASGIILAHSHPSGEMKPSQSDINLTQKLKEGAKLLDITLLDHLILSRYGYFSFADQGLL